MILLLFTYIVQYIGPICVNLHLDGGSESLHRSLTDFVLTRLDIEGMAMLTLSSTMLAFFAMSPSKECLKRTESLSGSRCEGKVSGVGLHPDGV